MVGRMVREGGGERDGGEGGRGGRGGRVRRKGGEGERGEGKDNEFVVSLV